MNETEKSKLKRLSFAIRARDWVSAAYWQGQCDALRIVGVTITEAFGCDEMTEGGAAELADQLMRMAK